MEIAQTDSLGWIRVEEMAIPLRPTEDFRVVDCTNKSAGTVASEGSRNMDDYKTSVANVYWRYPSRGTLGVEKGKLSRIAGIQTMQPRE